MEDVLSFFGNVGITTFLVGLIFKCLPEHILNNIFAKSLEKYKYELKNKSDEAIAKLNADLRVQAFQHEKSFAILQEKRALVIEEMYEKLVSFFSDVASLVSLFEYEGEISKQEKAKKCSESSQDFYSYFLTKRIYFEPKFCDNICKLYNDTVVLANRYNSRELHGTQRHKVEFECATKLKSDLEPLLKDLESEFRKIIGVK